jgi:hypothetical protein
MKGSPPVPHRQDMGRGTGIGLIDRALADAAWTPSSLPGRRYVPRGLRIRMRPASNGHGFHKYHLSRLRHTRGACSQRSSLKKDSCNAGNGNIWPSCARYRRRGARILFCYLSALPKVRLGGERDACVRRRSHRHQPPERRPSHCRAVFHTPTSWLRFPANRLAVLIHEVFAGRLASVA